MEVYLTALQRTVQEAIPDLENPPQPYRLQGNAWEQQHYLNRNDLAFSQSRHHKRYRGPKWLGDAFQIPLPPNHFFRLYIDDNRAEGQFRVRVYVRNEPPKQGGERKPHAMTVFMDRGFKSSMHAVDSFTVAAKEGTQVFEVFGNVLNYPGVDPGPILDTNDLYGTRAHFHYRFISVQNCSPLNSKFDKPVKNDDWVIHGDGHLVRADDQWIDAWGEKFGEENWLRRSHAGSQHLTHGQPSVYREVMQDTSYAVIERIEFDLPWQWPPQSVQPFLREGKLTNPSIRAEVLAFAERAWRRPLDKEELAALNQLINEKLKRTESKTDGLRDLLATVLSDSRFLYLTDVAREQRGENYELVSRLANYLWRSVPDEPLLKLAANDAPISDDELALQAERMLLDARSDRMIADFAASWLAFHKLDQIAVNPNYYGWWNPQFKDYLKLEAVAFLSTLLRENLSCLNCLESDFVVANDMMAKFYGIPVPESGHRFSRVPAPPHRGGVLTLPAFLLAHSTGEDAHAVHRGIWLRGRLLGDPPRDPPPAVPTLDDLAVPDADKLSTKDRLAAHRTGICYDCHKDIDPWGIALEAFDATGKYREQILRIPSSTEKRLKLPVVQATEIRDHKITQGDDLRKWLRAEYANQFGSGFTKSMLSFALGRPVSYQEDERVKQLAADFKSSDYQMRALIRAIVLSPEFKHPHGASNVK